MRLDGGKTALAFLFCYCLSPDLILLREVEFALVVLLIERVHPNEFPQYFGRLPLLLLVAGQLMDRAEIKESQSLLLGEHLQGQLVLRAEVEVAER